MRKALIFAERDLRLFFNTPGSYLVYFFFLISSSVWFYRVDNFLVRNRADFISYFSVFPYLLILIIPALTMSIWAGEKQEGTYELILSMPVSLKEIIAGKYAAVLVETAVMIILTLPVPLSLLGLGNFDAGQLAAQYAGVFLFSSFMTAIGLFVSAASSTQVQAYVASVMVLFLLSVPGLLFNPVLSGSSWISVLLYLSPSSHYAGFSKGIIDTRDVVYYVLGTLFFLILSEWKINSRRWS